VTKTGQPGLVSFVVASYNYARFLPRRIESLLEQTYENIEIIVIDDRSPDNSVEVLQRYASHPKVRLVVREQNGGWVTVSNQGVDLANGEFVMFANCDDDCDPRMVERLVAVLRQHPFAGLAFCRSLLVDDNDRVLGDDFAGRERAFRDRCGADTLIQRDEMGRFLMESCVVPNLSAALFRREIFDTVGYLSPAYKVVADWDLFFRLVSRYDVYYVAEPLNNFRQHPTTIRSSTKDRVVYAEYLRLLLPQLRSLDLRLAQRWRARRQVMSIWAGHLIAPSVSGLRNSAYHLGLVLKYDPASLLAAPVALLGRAARVAVKLVTGRTSPAALAS
jgi:glycosyltransferase involved in cell wall biosynthesis